MFSFGKSGTRDDQADARSFCVLRWVRSDSGIASVVRSVDVLGISGCPMFDGRFHAALRTSLEATVGVGDVGAKDHLVKELPNIPIVPVLLQLLGSLRQHGAEERVAGSPTRAVEDHYPGTLAAVIHNVQRHFLHKRARRPTMSRGIEGQCPGLRTTACSSRDSRACGRRPKTTSSSDGQGRPLSDSVPATSSPSSLARRWQEVPL